MFCTEDGLVKRKEPPEKPRLVQGAQPGSYALIAKKPNTCLLAAKMKARNDEAIYLENLERARKLKAYEDLRYEFEDNLSKKMFKKNIVREVTKMRLGDMIKLEVRRESLRNMLMEEEAEQVKEMDKGKETPLERQAKMRARANEFRAKREEKRMGDVASRYEAQFRRNCDDMRGALRHRFEMANAADNLVLIERNKEKKREEERMDAMWAKQWEEDRLVKEEREVREQTMRQSKLKAWAEEVRNSNTAGMRREAERKKEEEEEACLLQEQEEIMKLEQITEKIKEEKRLSDYRRELGVIRKMAARRECQKQLEELKMDTEMVERIKRELEEERLGLIANKARIKEELDTYSEYQKALKEQRECEDAKIGVLAEKEMERARQVREAEWQRNKDRRCRLQTETVGSWNEAIANQAEKEKERKKQSEIEAKENWEAIEESLALERKKAADRRHRDECHKHDLEQQIDYNGQLDENQKKEEERLYLHCLQREKEYQEKIKYSLEHPDFNTLHPVRVKAYQTGTLQDDFLKL